MWGDHSGGMLATGETAECKIGRNWSLFGFRQPLTEENKNAHNANTKIEVVRL
jgi:hypothetical protein